MAQKEASDQNTINNLTKIADYMNAANGNLFAAIAAKITTDVGSKFKDIPKDEWGKTVDQWVRGKYLDESKAAFIKSISDQPVTVRTILYLIAPLLIYYQDFKNSLNIASLEGQYHQMANVQPNPAPVEALVRSMMVDPARATENRATMKKYGYNDTQIDNIILSAYRLYDEGVIRTAYLRGVIDETKMYERMRELGYTDTRIKEIVPTWELLPGPQDLFTLVAHEAFEPDSIALMGLDTEFPTDQVDWLKKQGISEDWARKYWIAHWNQPSIGQGYEMLQRGVIDKDTLNLLYRTVEIPPFWRDKLTAIAYSPYTRVDVRRMHNLGIIDDNGLIKAYMDLGYDGEHALNMANFTIKYNAETDEGIARSTVLSSYHDQLMTRDEAKNLLTSQGLGETFAEFYLSLEDYKIAKESQDLQLKNISDRFLLGQISESELRNALNTAGLLGAKIDATIDNLKLQKYQYERLPTKTDCDNWLIKGIIQENEYYSLLTQMGFSQAHIYQYLQDIESERIFKGRAPTKSDLDRWVKAKYIDGDQYGNYLKGLGYSQTFIDLYKKDQKV